uniref:TSA: Wollemia nobilis Ref_Wollemi_Transcript_9002_3022 transcribed RNA sequence n=2 Tax=Wollemia nobilis TaxID=56998 RepID=A0A0C9QUD8_9CONI
MSNSRYQGPARQHPQSGPPVHSINSNNFMNSKQFGGGVRGAMMSRSGYNSSQIAGQKRDSSAFDVGYRGSQAFTDGGNFVKLFVGHLPRTVIEDDIRQLFAEHGNVLEVSMVRDQRIGQQYGCCFIKYATVEEAKRAINAFHNQYTFPGGMSPLQVRFADGDREQLGTVEHKLFVGSLNRQATEKDIEEIFSEFGPVDDVYIMKDEQKQSRGCAFVKYPSREMAAAAISKLNGVHIMKGCNQPLTVRFAEPKKPKVGDARNGPMFGGPGFGAEMQKPFGSRPALSGGGHTGGRGMSANWHPMGVANTRMPSPQIGSHPYGRPSTPTGRSGSLGGHSPAVGQLSGSQNSVNIPIEGPLNGSSTIGVSSRITSPHQQAYSSSSAQRQTQAHGWLPSVQQPPARQMQQHLQPSFQNQHQSTQSHSQLQASQQSLQQYGQHVPSLQSHAQQPQQTHSQLQAQQSVQHYGHQMQPSQPHAQQPTQFHAQMEAQQPMQQYGQQLQSSQQHAQQLSFGQVPPSQQQISTYGQLPVSQPQIQLHASSTLQQIPSSMPLHVMQHQHQQQVQQPSQQQPTVQLVQQQPPPMQTSVQSQPNSTFQQLQTPLMQAPSVQSSSQPQQQQFQVHPQQQQGYFQMASVQQAGLQQPWTLSAQPQAIPATSSMSTLSVATEATPVAAVVPVSAPNPAPMTCVWSEHTSPEGYKYYYNSVTGESKWEKPDELTAIEQQQQQQKQLHQLQLQSQPQLQPPQLQQHQLQHPQPQQQPQLSQSQQQQQPPLQHSQPSVSTTLSYGQLQGSKDTGSVQNPYMQQQTLSTPQDWMWKSRPGGI